MARGDYSLDVSTGLKQRFSNRREHFQVEVKGYYPSKYACSYRQMRSFKDRLRQTVLAISYVPVY